MSFNFNFGNNTSGGNTERKQVDWDALNKEVIDVVGTQKKAKSVVGYISGVVALGKQPQPDAEVVFVGTEEDERKAIAEKPQTYFKNGTDDKGNEVRLKCWPQRPVDCVAVTVDFPQYMVDKQKYFGDESKPLPLRLLMNGEFVFKGQPYSECGLGKLYKLNVRKNKDDKWSLVPNNKLYQMAVAVGVIEDGEPFLPNDVGNLIGKAALFEIRVYLKNDKYFTEEISLAGMIPEGLPVPEYDGSTLYGVYFNAQNDPECLKQLRVSIRNQMKKAEDYEGSVVQKELDSIFGNRNASEDKQEAVQGDKPAESVKAKAKQTKAPVEPPIDFDTDIPF
jgi:hypothetical protein